MLFKKYEENVAAPPNTVVPTNVGHYTPIFG
jgi:hypothetical protein